MTGLRKGRLVIRLAIPLALGACTGPSGFGNRVIQDYVSDNYEPHDVRIFAAAGGSAAIYGTTTDGADASEIAAAMRLPAHATPRRITAGPTGERSGPHLVLIFAPGTTTPKKACKGLARGGQAGPDMRVLGVFCSSYGTPVSEAMLIAADTPSPAAPDFQQKMSRLLTVLMPSRNPTAGDRRIRRRN